MAGVAYYRRVSKSAGGVDVNPRSEHSSSELHRRDDGRRLRRLVAVVLDVQTNRGRQEKLEVILLSECEVQTEGVVDLGNDVQWDLASRFPRHC
jgi:hypothetical protein